MKSIDQREESFMEENQEPLALAVVPDAEIEAIEQYGLTLPELVKGKDDPAVLDETDPVRIYYHTISRYPGGLTYDQQQIAFTLLREDANTPASKLRTVKFLGKPPQPDESGEIDEKETLQYDSLLAALDDSQTVRDAIFLTNTRLAAHMATVLGAYGRALGMSQEDLIQYANEGLNIAVDRYDLDKKYVDSKGIGHSHRFSTYATWWIQQSVKRAVANYSRNVRLPVYMHEAIYRVKREVNTYYQANGEEPTRDRLRELLDGKIRLGSIDSALDVYYSGKHLASRSLDQQAFLGDGKTIGDGIVDASVNVEEEGTENTYMQALRDEIYRSLGRLDERKRSIIEKRFGLNGQEPATLEELGHEFGVSRERIRQIEAEVLKKLRGSTDIAEHARSEFGITIKANGRQRYSTVRQRQMEKAAEIAWQRRVEERQAFNKNGDVLFDRASH